MFNNNTSCFSGRSVPSTGQMTDAQGNLLHLRRAHNRPLSSSSSMQLIICVIAKIWRLWRRDTFICDWGRTHFDCEWISHGWSTFKMSEGGRGGKENRMLINKLIFLRAADDSLGLALSWNGEKLIQMVNNCLCLHEELQHDTGHSGGQVNTARGAEKASLAICCLPTRANRIIYRSYLSIGLVVLA